MFGLGVAAFPILAIAALVSKRTRMRSFLLLLLLLQAAIMLEAVKIANWTQRYTLQASVPFLVLTVLGVRALLGRLPERWDRRLMPVVSLLLVRATGGALRDEWRQHGRARSETIRRAFAYVDSCAADDEKIYVDISAEVPFYTKRTFDVLAGFKPFKGGLIGIDKACDATEGWVVVTHLEQGHLHRRSHPEYRGTAPNWLEVFRAENNRGKYFARAFRILPEPPARSIRIINKPTYPAEAPDVAGLAFQAIDLSGPPETLVSKRWHRGMQRVDITRNDGGLRCDLIGDPQDEGSQYGGVRFAVPGMRALCFDLELINAGDITNAYVYVYGSEKGQHVKWRWNLSSVLRKQGFRGPVVLVPSEACGHFCVQGELTPELIREVNVFVRIKPGAQAGFILREMEVCGADAPDADAVSSQPVQE